ncbi:shikimate dehydrogenase family protein [Paenibacillus sp. NPDC058071]|uniref:shikimate dehydrogenase family protein n=1 Tax=Paenibacillus sp. NPDC058071 TaxID=3346326 RepID=UPI0036DA11ED
MILPEKATEPTMYFIGVTTGKSSIMKLFPEWAKVLGLDGAVIKGIDIAIHADPAEYRRVVEFIRDDELSMGALVTTHKIDLYDAAKDLFDELDPYATMFGELSSISKLDGKLIGHAKDPITSGLAMEAFVPEGYWEKNGGELFVMGAGGSAIAICSTLLEEKHGKDIPSRIVVTNRSEPRLKEIERIVRTLRPDVPADFYLTPDATDNDAAMLGVKPNSLIVNATGLGKDRPGSPLTDDSKFPQGSLVWELNYRGELDFMKQANAVATERDLTVEDGWIYFLHGWTQVIAEVFHLDMTQERFDRIEKLSAATRS